MSGHVCMCWHRHNSCQDKNYSGEGERKFKEFRIVYFVGPDWPLRLFKRAFLPFESNEVFMLFLSTN